jgi:cytochrome c5
MIQRKEADQMTVIKNSAKNRTENKRRIVSAVIAILAIASACAAVKAQQSTLAPPALASATSAVPTAVPASPYASNDAAAQAAFLRSWTVFNSPRCRNCHPAGDAPLQGDDSHVHIQNVKRGPDGHGLYGMKCNTCHQLANTPGDNMPPGNPKWGLPPPNMKMVIVGETPGQFCRQLKDPAQNGGRTLAQIITHVSSDDLVGWAWNPGDGRALPPLTRPDFANAVREWVNNGAACPQ